MPSASRAQNENPRGQWARCLQVSTEFCGSSLGSRYLEKREGKGRRAREEFRIACGEAEVALVAPSEQGFVLRFQKDWQGWACVGGRTYALRELIDSGWATPGDAAGVFTFAIPADCTLVVQLDFLEHWIRPTQAVEKVPKRALASVGDPIFRYGLAATLLVLGLVFAAGNLPEAPRTLSSNRFDPSPFLLQPRVATEPSTETLRPVKASKVQPRRTPMESRKGPEDSEDASAAELETVDSTKARASRAGIAGLSTRETFEEVAATVDFSYSEEEAERLKGLLPSEVDAATGAWGHGIRKIGPGSGDGKDWGTVKSGDYELASEESIGNAYAAKALSRPHEAMAPVPDAALASILDSGIKYDVIRGQLGLRKRRFSLCFENAISDDEDWPSLVHVRFEIAPSGKVTVAELEEGEGHGARACVEETLRSIQFPEPSDGKLVRVEHFPVRV